MLFQLSMGKNKTHVSQSEWDIYIYWMHIMHVHQIAVLVKYDLVWNREATNTDMYTDEEKNEKSAVGKHEST